MTAVRVFNGTAWVTPKFHTYLSSSSSSWDAWEPKQGQCAIAVDLDNCYLINANTGQPTDYPHGRDFQNAGSEQGWYWYRDPGEAPTTSVPMIRNPEGSDYRLQPPDWSINYAPYVQNANGSTLQGLGGVPVYYQFNWRVRQLSGYSLTDGHLRLELTYNIWPQEEILTEYIYFGPNYDSGWQFHRTATFTAQTGKLFYQIWWMQDIKKENFPIQVHYMRSDGAWIPQNEF